MLKQNHGALKVSETLLARATMSECMPQFSYSDKQEKQALFL